MAPSRRRDAFINKLNQGEELTGSTVIKKSSVGLSVRSTAANFFRPIALHRPLVKIP